MSPGPYFMGSVAGRLGVSWGFGGSSADQGVKTDQEVSQDIKNLQQKIALLDKQIENSQQLLAAGFDDGSGSSAELLKSLKLARRELDHDLEKMLADQKEQLLQQSNVIAAQAQQIDDQRALIASQQDQLASILQRLQVLEAAAGR